ncbi:uncharacterized protein DSM5745_09306 [Aspergillus mulundensis]|uniref:Uncharacterized protein n=1 Tax=Aspergillus mulundensis TaxID=1810919 RepID=A0A3D8R0J0_9EURO|nr:hypothetical protein DSM5745_09306 [Aspergillus mulundensis]RDW67440.1 hypothetical protein DSM5745_09306 [Aspergillus mulundensis]
MSPSANPQQKNTMATSPPQDPSLERALEEWNTKSMARWAYNAPNDYELWLVPGKAQMDTYAVFVHKYDRSDGHWFHCVFTRTYTVNPETGTRSGADSWVCTRESIPSGPDAADIELDGVQGKWPMCTFPEARFAEMVQVFESHKARAPGGSDFGAWDWLYECVERGVFPIGREEFEFHYPETRRFRPPH